MPSTTIMGTGMAVGELIKTLVDLDKKLQEFDENTRNIRIAIHNIFWELIESRGNKVRKKMRPHFSSAREFSGRK